MDRRTVSTALPRPQRAPMRAAEADDFSTVTRALGPLNTIGTGSITPVVTLDQAIPMADAGSFRPRT